MSALGDHGRFSTGKEAGPKLMTLPAFRHWALGACALSVLAAALGLATRFVPGYSGADLGLVQELGRHHSPVLTFVALALDAMFAPLAGGFIVLMVSLYLLLRGAVVNAVAFGLVASSGSVASEFFKVVIARPGPDPALFLDPLSLETGSSSFPSGHTCFAITVAVGLYFLARGTRWAKATAAVGAGTALAVALSRVYLGVNYPADVAASFLTAPAAILLLAGLWNRHAPRLLASYLPPAR